MVSSQWRPELGATSTAESFVSRNVNLITLKKKVETRKMSDLPDPGPLIGHRQELLPLIGEN